MALLAHSLLAVLALLQAACALHPEYYPPGHRNADDDIDNNPSCKTYYFGRHGEIKYDLPPIHVYQPGSKVEVKENRDFLGAELVGEKVAACDWHRQEAPQVSLSSPDSFDFLQINGGASDPSPAHIELRVTRFRAEPAA